MHNGPMRRVVVGVSLGLSLVLVALAVFAVVGVRRSFPDMTGEVRLDGISGPIEIVRDDHGIPQVYADTPEDLFFGQGYVQAQDRFWEMDFRRHVTAGRLAELVGESALDTDKFVRTLGWRRVAEAEVELVDEDTRQLLDSYSEGVNSYIDGKGGSSLSLEYQILSLSGTDYRPAPWTAADSVAWIKAMAWDLRSNMSDEADRVLSTARLTPDRVEQLYPDYPEDHPTIVTSSDLTSGAVAEARSIAPAGFDPGSGLTDAMESISAAQSAADQLPTLLGTGDGIGSNSWVVSGDRTETGLPILANDPHLAPSMPGIWYQVGLHCRTVSEACPYDVSGFSFAGLPGVVVGHNRDVAWGVTTLYADVADLTLEKVSGGTYLYDGEQVPLETREETFEVAGGESETITVRSTRNGPILSDLDDSLAKVGRSEQTTTEASIYEVALRWTALTPEPTIEAVFALDTASSWEEFRDAAQKFTVPSQNLVYADREGNIGYQSPGTIPTRRTGDGRWPVPGWDPAYDWTGTIPFERLPSVLNPDEGFIVTANNKVIDDDYPFLLGADTAPGYRADRIRELLDRDEPLSVQDMTEMQMDSLNANAQRLVPELLDVDPGGAYYSAGQDLLRDWDLEQDTDSGAAAYFNAVWNQVLALTFRDELPPDQWPDGGARWFQVVDGLLDTRGSRWWDDVGTEQVETRDVVLRTAMRRARDDMTSLQSKDPEDWSWGRLHQLELVNPTLGESGIGAIEGLFNRGPFDVPGGGGLVNATSSDFSQGFGVTAVPSMRMVVDLDDLDRSRWIQLTGNSGHAFQGNYLDQFPLWQRGETLPWAFSAGAVAESARHTLTLQPAAR